MDPVLEIKNRLNIEEVVADYVQLRRAGRNFKGLCPFHNEKTPSFIVSPEKQLAYCFGCQKGGDMFKFVEEIENVDFKEALKILAQKAGVTLEHENLVSSSKKGRFFEMHELATKLYESYLKQALGKEALEYLRKRGVSEETIKQFRIGFAPQSWDNLSKKLRASGYSDEEIVSSGLGIWHDKKSDGTYDRFRQRVLFPLIDNQGRVLGFSGRILGAGEPKYLNSPESLIFHKKNFIYGFNLARQTIKEKDFVLFTEGQMDTIMCHQAGFKQAVATSGTALTPEHLKTVKRFSSNLVFAFDTDQAGVSATERAIELALGEDFEVKILSELGGKDPAEIISKDPGLFEQALKKASNWFDFFFQTVFEKLDLENAKVKQKISASIFNLISKLPGSISAEHYLKLLAKKLSVSLEAVKQDFRNFKKPHEFNDSTLAATKDHCRRDECLLGILINHPKELAYGIGALENFQAISEPLKEAFSSLKNYYLTNEPHFVISDFLATLKSIELKKRVEFLSLYIEENYQSFEETEIHKEVKDLLDHIKESFKRGSLKLLNIELKRAEEGSDQEKINLLLEKQRDLLK